MQVLDVGNDLAYQSLAGPMPARLDTFSQFGQGRGFQFAANQHCPVYTRFQRIAVNGDIGANLLGGFFRKPGQCFKPHLGLHQAT